MKSVNQFSVDLLWFPDLRIYEDDTTETDGVETDSSAYRFLQKAIIWITRERALVEYSIPINQINILVELCDPIVFNDPIFTDGSDRDGWICGIAIDTTRDVIDITAILEAV